MTISRRLGDLRALIEKAVEDFERARAALHRSDGQPLYGEAETRDRLRELESERNRALTEAERGAREVREEAGREIEWVENADPLASLTPEELAAANARRALALDSAEAMDAEDLEKRLRSVLAGGNRAEIERSRP
jgi:hypothetical protein